MSAIARHVGARDALETFGLSKYAGIFSADFWKDVGRQAKQQAIGNPGEALRQIHQGKLWAPGGLYRTGLPQTAGQLVGSLVLPLGLTALYAGANPPESRGELVGDAVGRITGSLLGGPLFGAVGQVGGGMLLANVGRNIGRQVDSWRHSDVAPST